MSAKNNGGAAFPGERGMDGYGHCKLVKNESGENKYIDLNQGMSLRDYFAAKALGAILSHEKNIICLAVNDKNGGVNAMAADAYFMADAMLIERDKP